MVGPNVFTVSSDRSAKGASKTLPPLELLSTDPVEQPAPPPKTITSESAAVAAQSDRRPTRLPIGMVIVSLLLGSAIVAGIALWPVEQSISNEKTLASATRPPDALVVVAAPPDAGVAALDVVPDSAAEAGAIVAKVVTKRPARKGRPRRHVRPPPKKPLPKPVEPRKKGWIQIGGSLLSFRGPIVVDGKSYEAAPRHVKVPVGPHKVVVYDEKRTRKLLDVSVVVTETHTRDNALRLIRRLPSEQ
jgi:hypothetical protein